MNSELNNAKPLLSFIEKDEQVSNGKDYSKSALSHSVSELILAKPPIS